MLKMHLQQKAQLHPSYKATPVLNFNSTSFLQQLSALAGYRSYAQIQIFSKIYACDKVFICCYDCS